MKASWSDASFDMKEQGLCTLQMYLLYILSLNPSLSLGNNGLCAITFVSHAPSPPIFLYRGYLLHILNLYGYECVRGHRHGYRWDVLGLVCVHWCMCTCFIVHFFMLRSGLLLLSFCCIICTDMKIYLSKPEPIWAFVCVISFFRSLPQILWPCWFWILISILIRYW